MGSSNQMLFEFGADLSPFQTAFNNIKSLLDDLNKLTDQQQSSTQQATRQQASLSDQMTAAAKQAVQAALDLVKADNSRFDTLQKQTDELKSQLASQALLLRGTESQTTAEREHLRVLSEQSEEHRKQSEHREGGRKEGGSELLEQVASKLGGAAFGATFGELTGAFVGGNLIAKGIEQAVEGLSKFIEKLKDVSIEAGKLSLMDDQFDRLARGAGVDATRMMERLTEATEGLVSRFELTKVAVTALESPLGVSAKDLEELTEAIVKIVEYSGGTAQQAIERLNQTFRTGRIQVLGSLPGMDRFSLMLNNISSTAGPSTRRLAEFGHALDQIKKRGQEIGETPATLEQSFERINTSISNIFMSFGEGLNKSAGIQSWVKSLKSGSDGLNELSKRAQEFGDHVGNAIGYAQVMGKAWLETLKALAKAVRDIISAVDDLLPDLGLTGKEWGKWEFILGLLLIMETGIKNIAAETTYMAAVAKTAFEALGYAIAAPIAMVLGQYKMGMEFLERSGVAIAKTGKNIWESGGGGMSPEALDALRNRQIADQTAKLRRPIGTPTGVQQRAGPLPPHGTQPSDFPEAESAQDKLTDTLNVNQAKLDKQLADLFKIKAEANLDVKRTTKTLKHAEAPGDPRFRQDEELARAELNLQKALDKEKLDAKEAEIAKERIMEDEAYRSGEERLEEHIDRLRTLNQEEIQAKLERAQDDYFARIKELQIDERLKLSQAAVTPEAAEHIKKISAVNQAVALSAWNDQRSAITREGENKDYQIVKQGQMDKYKLYLEAIQKSQQLQQTGITEQASIDKERLENQEITAEEYLKRELQSAQDTLSTQQTGLTLQLAAAKSFGENVEKVEQDVAEKRLLYDQQFEAKRREQEEKAAQLRLQGITSRFEPQQKILESREGFQQQNLSGTFNLSSLDLAQKMVNSLKGEMAALMAEAEKPDAINNPKTWMAIYEQIIHISQAQAEWNEKLRDLQSTLTQVAPAFAKIGESIGQNIHTKFGQNLAESIKAGADVMANAPKWFDQIRGKPTEDPRLKALQDQAEKIFEKLKPGTDATTTALSSLSKAALDAGNKLAELTGVMQFKPGAHTGSAGLTGPHPQTGLAGPPAPTISTPQGVAPIEVSYRASDIIPGAPTPQQTPTPPETPKRTGVTGSDGGPVNNMDFFKSIHIPNPGIEQPPPILGLPTQPTGAQPGTQPIQQTPSILGQTTTLLTSFGTAVEAATRYLTAFVAAPKKPSTEGLGIERPKAQQTQPASGTAQQNTNQTPAVQALDSSVQEVSTPLGQLGTDFQQLLQSTNPLPTIFQAILSGAASLVAAYQTAVQALNTASSSISQGSGSGGLGGGGGLLGGGAGGGADSGGGDYGSGEAGGPDTTSTAGGDFGTTNNSSGETGAGSVPSSNILGSLTKLAGQFTGLVSVLDGFASSILNAKSALSGAVGGLTSGASLGGQIGGPIGAAIGAVVGATLGAVFGEKNAQVTEQINNMNATFKNLMIEFQSNTNNLQSTISQIDSLMAEAQQMQASSKKGHSQYQQLINQYSQQLVQFQQQQNQTLQQMNEQVAVLTEPTGGQQFLQTIQQIVQTYEQFEGAAKNATDLATANQFLTLSLQQYEQNLENQLNQDNQQAIQDALQLNDLLYQRQQMILQYNDQVQSILSQGVLTRQFTRAETAGQQIQQLTVQYQMQLDATNEEISATQFRVNAEQQIFNLATDRIGLENQLLAVQNAQASYQMQAISALQGVVNQLASANLSGGALGLLLSVMQTVTNPAAGVPTNTSILQVIQTLTGFLSGTPPANSIPPSQSTAQVESNFGGAYQDRASMGFGKYRAQNL